MKILTLLLFGILISMIFYKKSRPNKPHLMLYFDVNQTLIMVDPASGKTLEKTLQSILSKRIWGKVTSSGWKLVSSVPSISSPDKGLITYSHYLDKLHPEIPSRPGESTEEKKLRAEKNKKIRRKRKAFKRNSIEEGQPGASLKKFYEELLHESLRLPEEAEKKLGRKHYFIIPAFFHFLNHLEKNNRSYNIIFRTFGIDVVDVTEEFHLFLKGKHPIFPRKHKAPTREAELSANLGCFHRTDESTSLNLGTLLARTKDKSPFTQPPTHSLVGHKLIYDHLLKQSKAGVHLSFQDHHAYWISKKERSATGKLHFVDPSDKTVHPLFFDDNIKPDKAHIVAVVNAKTGESIPFKESLNKWIYRVDPIAAIKNPNYFIKALEVCE